MTSRNTDSLPSISQSDVLLIGQPILESLTYLLNRLLSCWHLKMSRPIKRGRESYRACVRCGMRRRFDLEEWKSVGRFYLPSVERRSDR